MSVNIYLAGPFFDEEQIDRVSRAEEALTKNASVDSFFSPRKHQHPELEMFSKEWQKATFASDVEAIENADVLVTLIDYEAEHVDPGTAWEFGYAVKANKPVIVVKEKPGSVNLMLSEPSHAYLTDVADLATYDFNELPKSEFTGEVF